MKIKPDVCKVESALRPLASNPDSENVMGVNEKQRKLRALDVGGGVGRTTKDVLLHLVDEVVLLEPVHKFVMKAKDDSSNWKGISNCLKSVTFVELPLQNFDPSEPIPNNAIVGCNGALPESQIGFDIIWCQWCLGHLSDRDLVSFFKKARSALKPFPDSVIVVKENLCQDGLDGSPRSVFDDQDSSFTRSDAKWLRLFKDAGLRLIYQQVQEGFPSELYKVKMYALQ